MPGKGVSFGVAWSILLNNGRHLGTPSAVQSLVVGDGELSTSPSQPVGGSRGKPNCGMQAVNHSAKL